MPDKIRLSDIIEEIEKHHSGVDTWTVNRAYVYSAKVHQGQLRKSGEPYLTHPLAVAMILASKGMDLQTVAAGLLHDTLEDTWATVEDLDEVFGADVRKLVEGVTKLSQFTTSSKEERQIQSFRRLILASIDDPRVLVIKLADRLHNMRTIGSMKEESQKRIAEETLNIYAPIAHRLGMHQIQDELEDRSFAILQPEIAADLAQKRASYIADQAEYTEKIMSALTEIMASNELAGTVSGRTKHTYSIHRKMLKDQCRFEDLYDIIAFRVIVDDISACYFALGIVHGLWQPMAGRIKDYIATPKPNGYQSLHTTVLGSEGTLIEIQIRTPEMHRYAEEGIAAHWRYKDGGGETQTQVEFYRTMRAVLENTDSTDKAESFFDQVKDGIKQGQIFVFTPKGDVIELPSGSTILDFAYRIHTEVGHRCSGALVNGRWVPIRQVVNNGDIVSIQTQAGHVPKRDWLNIAKTNGAKAKIRSFLKDLESEEGQRQGKDILDRIVRNAGAGKKLSQKESEHLARLLGVNDVVRMYNNIGSGRTSPQLVREKLLTVMGEDNEKGLRLSVPEGLGRWIKRAPKERPELTIEGEDGLMLRLAKCCKPIQGDEVVGFVTRGKGITVHRADCKTLASSDPARLLTAKWADDKDKSRLHTVRLRVLMKDQPGVLAKISQVIARQGVNIAQTNLNTTAQGGEGIFVVLVRNRDQLDRLVATLRKTKGIKETERIS